MKRIAIHSAPRSGSTWLGSLFDSCPNVIYKYQPLFSYKFKSYLNTSSTKDELISFFKKIHETQDDFLDQTDAKKQGHIPTFQKNGITSTVYKEVRYHHVLKNMLEQDKQLKVIGLVRNPLSVVNSWLNAPKEFKKELNWQVSEQWRYASAKNLNRMEEFNGYEKWKEITILFERLNTDFPDQFHLIQYDRLLKDTLGQIKEAFLFCGLDITDQTRTFIQQSSSTENHDPYSVFRKKQNDDKWKKGLPPHIIKTIKHDLIESNLESYIPRNL